MISKRRKQKVKFLVGIVVAPQVIISQMKSNVEAEKTANDPKFPWMALIVLPCAYALYTFSANLVLLGPAVPIFNVAFLVGGAYYLIVHSK